MKIEPKHERIISAIESGIITLEEIAKAAKLKESSAEKALEQLIKAGLIIASDSGYQKPTDKPVETEKPAAQPCSVRVTFQHSQNVTHLTKVFEFFGYEVIRSTIKQLDMHPPACHNQQQVNDDIDAILKDYTRIYQAYFMNMPQEAQNSTALPISRTDWNTMSTGTQFSHHGQIWSVVRMVNKKRIPHDNITMPADVSLDFVAVAEDGTVNEFWIDGTRKTGFLSFKKYNGKIEEGWQW